MTEKSKAFLKEISDYLGNEAKASPESMFRLWLRDAINTWLMTDESSSFAPFDDRFRNQREPIENFLNFIEQDLPGLGRIGVKSARGLTAEVLGGLLAGISEPGSPFVVRDSDLIYTSQTAADVFRALHSVDRIQAVDWFCRYLSLWRSGTHQRDVRQRALPVTFFQAVPNYSSSDKLGAALSLAMFDWCKAHTTEKGVSLIAVDVLCLRLAAISRTKAEQTKRSEALRVLGKFADPAGGDDVTMAEAVAEGLDGLVDSVRRWEDGCAKVNRALVGIDLSGARPSWADRVSTPLFDGMPWRIADAEARLANRPAARRTAGVLERIERGMTQPDRSLVRPELAFT